MSANICPGLISPETVIWCAKHRYPYVALATMLKPTLELWNMYGKVAADFSVRGNPITIACASGRLRERLTPTPINSASPL